MLPLRRSGAIAVVLLAVLAAPGARSARAQGADVEAKISLLGKKPSGMGEDEWREKRRDAAKELGRLGDKRAVEPLIRIVETERFDAIAELAIEALGRLGDKRAVGPLRKVYDDASRDRYTRDAAANALRHLGADPEPDEGGGGEGGGGEGGREVKVGGGGAEGGGETGGGEGDGDGGLAEHETVPAGPVFGPDLLAATERWTLAVGSLSMTYDSPSRRAQLSGVASTRWQRGREKPTWGFAIDAGLAVAGGARSKSDELNAEAGRSGEVNVAGQAAADARFYAGKPGGIFGHLDGALALGASATVVKAVDPAAMDFKDFAPTLSVLVGVGVGWGRILDVGVTLRLRRIERVLRENRLLGRPIHDDLARKIFSTWWALRGEVGVRHRLLATLALLREAGVLLQDPDPATVYALVRVLEDGQLDGRLDGLDARIGVAETFAGADPAPMADDVEWSRTEAAFLLARVGRQLRGGAQEVVGTARATYKLAGDGPGFYTAGAEATWRRWFYGGAWDPRGALELGASAALSNLDRDNADAASRIGAEVGYLFVPSRASRLRASAEVALEGDEMFVGVAIEGTYGFLDAAIAPF